MTEQERQQAYIEAIKALSVQFGYEIQAQIVVDNLGGGILHKPQLALVPVPNWQPPTDITADIENIVQPNRHELRKEAALNGK